MGLFSDHLDWNWGQRSSNGFTYLTRCVPSRHRQHSKFCSAQICPEQSTMYEQARSFTMLRMCTHDGKYWKAVDTTCWLLLTILRQTLLRAQKIVICGDTIEKDTEVVVTASMNEGVELTSKISNSHTRTYTIHEGTPYDFVICLCSTTKEQQTRWST
jgi:hypothetical protein